MNTLISVAAGRAKIIYSALAVLLLAGVTAYVNVPRERVRTRREDTAVSSWYTGLLNRAVDNPGKVIFATIAVLVMVQVGYRPDDSEEEIDIVVRYPEDQRSIRRLDQIRLETGQSLVPISNFVKRVM